MATTIKDRDGKELRERYFVQYYKSSDRSGTGTAAIKRMARKWVELDAWELDGITPCVVRRSPDEVELVGTDSPYRLVIKLMDGWSAAGMEDNFYYATIPDESVQTMTEVCAQKLLAGVIATKGLSIRREANGLQIGYFGDPGYSYAILERLEGPIGAVYEYSQYSATLVSGYNLQYCGSGRAVCINKAGDNLVLNAKETVLTSSPVSESKETRGVVRPATECRRIKDRSKAEEAQKRLDALSVVATMLDLDMKELGAGTFLIGNGINKKQ